jgi:hypothetical protein
MRKNLLAAPAAQALPMPPPSDPVATALEDAAASLSNTLTRAAELQAAATRQSIAALGEMLAKRKAGACEFVIRRNANGLMESVIARPCE